VGQAKQPKVDATPQAVREIAREAQCWLHLSGLDHAQRGGPDFGDKRLRTLSMETVGFIESPV